MVDAQSRKVELKLKYAEELEQVRWWMDGVTPDLTLATDGAGVRRWMDGMGMDAYCLLA